MSTESRTESSSAPVGAIVMANGDACHLAHETGAPHKALLDICGMPMIDRVLEAVRGCPSVGDIIVSCRPGGPIAQHLDGRVPLASPEDPTFLGGIAEGFRLLPEMSQAMLVTCDMPLLTPEAVCFFAREAAQWPTADVVYGMVDVVLTREKYPETHRTSIHLREGKYTAAGLCLVSRRFVDECGPHLMQAFQARKSKLALAKMLGYGFLVRLVLGQLTLRQIKNRAEELLEGEVAVVSIPHPECGFDVDSHRDLVAARQALARLQPGR